MVEKTCRPVLREVKVLSPTILQQSSERIILKLLPRVGAFPRVTITWY